MPDCLPDMEDYRIKDSSQLQGLRRAGLQLHSINITYETTCACCYIIINISEPGDYNKYYPMLSREEVDLSQQQLICQQISLVI